VACVQEIFQAFLGIQPAQEQESQLVVFRRLPCFRDMNTVRDYGESRARKDFAAFVSLCFLRHMDHQVVRRDEAANAFPLFLQPQPPRSAPAL